LEFKNTANLGNFGNYVGGGIGTLFKLTGVVLIYLTLKRQEENSNPQQLETTFFKLSNHRDIVKSLSGILHNIKYNDHVRKKGRNFYHYFLNI
jgi:hypothetical protein